MSCWGLSRIHTYGRWSQLKMLATLDSSIASLILVLTYSPQRIPRCISIPFLEASEHLEVPPVVTYAACCLWNFQPIYPAGPIDLIENLTTLCTFTGTMDESWFYLVSVAIEARGAPTVPLMIEAMQAARRGDSLTVSDCLAVFAERIMDLRELLGRLTERCTPHAFYFRIRPFLAGSKNMGEAGLPHGVLFEDGSGTEKYRQYSGGSNAQSSLIQFFDIALGVQHRPTGVKKETVPVNVKGHAPPPKHNFIEVRTPTHLHLHGLCSVCDGYM
jgi:indoleamine 2,3-dioxygenase